VNLRSLDLNLLVVFDAVFGERNITRAGLKVGLSQPAVSNSLTRLRGHLKDELFLRSPRGLRPTPRAIEIAGPIHAMLVELERVLDPTAFDPATAQRSFTIAAVDYFTIVVAPRLAMKLAKQAPGVDVRIVPTAGQAMELLDRGGGDCAVDASCGAPDRRDLPPPAAAFGDVPDRFGHRTIVEDDYACMVAARHPFAQRAPTLRGYAGARHILVSPRGDARGFVDEKLAEKGLTRRIAMTVNHFSAAPGLVAETDLVLTAPRKVLEAFASRKTAVFDCPVAAPLAYRRLDILWHERLSRHPAHAWFRDLLAAAAP
jgi:DNA-binding transcriptional LysR family regulator